MSDLVSTGGGHHHPAGCTCPFCTSAAHGEADVTLTRSDVNPTRMLDVSRHLAGDGYKGGRHAPDDIRAAYRATGQDTDSAESADAVVAQLYTEHESGNQSWFAVDADDRWPGQFVEHTADRDGIRLRITPGNSDTYTADGFSWTTDAEAHVFSGDADTLAEAQQQAVEHADYVTSGGAEADDYRARGIEDW